jgi:uncharacterized membrane protein (UPF0127 family)
MNTFLKRTLTTTAIIALISTLAVLFFKNIPIAEQQPIIQNTLSETTQKTSAPSVLEIAGNSIELEIARTPAERQQGLSGRTGLPENKALLFIFEDEGFYNFWMKDMKFSIDMIWLDADYTVVGLHQNVAPDTFPDTFTSTKPALFVLETAAGFAQKYGIKEGTRLTIK